MLSIQSNISFFYFPFSEAKARKAVTYNYACMLVLLVVQTSNDLRMMEQYAAPLLTLAKADDTNAKLQGKYRSCHTPVLCYIRNVVNECLYV